MFVRNRHKAEGIALGEGVSVVIVSHQAAFGLSVECRASARLLLANCGKHIK